MSNVRSQGGSNREAPEVISRYVPSRDDIAIQIKRVRESSRLCSEPLSILSLWKIGPESCHKT